MPYYPKINILSQSIISIITVVLFIFCLFFLFNSHADTLIQTIPDSAEIYLHAKSAFIKKMPAKHQALLLEWLTNASVIKEQQWQDIFSKYQGETAFFTINNQVFCIAKNKKQLANLLNANGIGFSQINKAIIFPKLQLNATIKNNWAMNLRPKASFAELHIFIKDLKSFRIPEQMLNNELRSPLFLSGSYETNRLILKTANVGIDKFSFSDSFISQLPTNVRLYFNNVKLFSTSQNADFTLNNLPFLLLKQFNGKLEYLETFDNQFAIITVATAGLDNVKKNILANLAMLLPTETAKLLPDQTIAKQLIADPSRWTFQTIQEAGLTIDNLKEPLLKLDLRVYEQNGELIITNNINLSGLNSNQNPTSDKGQTKDTLQVDKITRQCGLLTNNLIYLSLSKSKLANYLNHILITNGLFNKISICID